MPPRKITFSNELRRKLRNRYVPATVVSYGQRRNNAPLPPRRPARNQRTRNQRITPIVNQRVYNSYNRVMAELRKMLDARPRPNTRRSRINRW